MSETKLRRLDLTLLLVLDEALRHRKLTEVAARLGLSQPAISHALVRLRDIFDDPLFHRRPGGVEPTPRCLDLAPHVASILALARNAVSPAPPFDPATSTRIFRLTGLDYEASFFGPALLQRFAAVAPGLRLSFRPHAREAALRALAEGEVDVALGYFPRRPAEVAIQPLYEESYLVAAAADHPRLARRRNLDLPLYCALDHILVSVDGGLEGMVDAALARLGERRRVVAAMPNFLPALAAVATAPVVVTMPSRVVQGYAARFGLRAFAPPLALRSFTLMAAWHRRQEGDPGLHWLMQQVMALTETVAARTSAPARRRT